MIAALALVLAQTSSAPSGPSILMIRRTNGRDFVQFSSFGRCQAAKRFLEAEVAEARRLNQAKGYVPVPGIEPQYRRIAG